MSHPTVRGVVVVTRNGDRFDYYQDPFTYQSSHTDSTPLGEVRQHAPSACIGRCLMVTCRSKRSSLAHSCARNTSTRPQPTTFITFATSLSTLTRSMPESKTAARAVLSSTPPSHSCKAYSLPPRRTRSSSQMRRRSLPRSVATNMSPVSTVCMVFLEVV